MYHTITGVYRSLKFVLRRIAFLLWYLELHALCSKIGGVLIRANEHQCSDLGATYVHHFLEVIPLHTMLWLIVICKNRYIRRRYLGIAESSSGSIIPSSDGNRFEDGLLYTELVTGATACMFASVSSRRGWGEITKSPCKVCLKPAACNAPRSAVRDGVHEH